MSQVLTDNAAGKSGLPVVLTIGGSDCSGGAGVQADLKTFHQFGVYGASVLTLVTAQNTLGVQAVHGLPDAWLQSQLDSVLHDLSPSAIKLGAMGSAATMEIIANALRSTPVPVVVDPVMISKHGHALLDRDAVETLKRTVIPLATLVTPNAFEAAALVGCDVEDVAHDPLSIAERLLELGAQHVVLKTRSGSQSVDWLFGRSVGAHRFEGTWIESAANHGSGCVLSAAITAGLAIDGLTTLPQIVKRARDFVHAGIRSGAQVGQGIQPVNTLVTLPPWIER